MKLGFLIVLLLAGSLGVARQLAAQAPAGPDSPQTDQNKPADTGRKPAATQQPGAKPQSGANPFPEDTSKVPVLPSSTTPTLPVGTYYGAESGAIPMRGDDLDPVRSPDDPESVADSSQPDSSSSSLNGIDKLLPSPDDDQPEKRGKSAAKQPNHQEAASKDIEIGSYYLDTKNWKAALSRFESAMVLDPENPDVFWGMAEAERHLGQFANAKAHFLKVVDYDPDSRHGKEARKALQDPALANAKKVEPGQPAAGAPK